MEYSPPPLFKQGASARAKVVIFSVIAILLLMVDSHLHSLVVIRQAVGTALYPLERLALMPRDAMFAVGDYFSSLSRLEKENRQLKTQQIANAQALQQAQLLSAENAQLRKLLSASERLPVKSLMSEILYDARDAFTRKIVLDRGSRNGVAAGQPVIDDTGVVGQITRVFPFTAEATLLTDKDQAIPVQVVRSGLRSVAYGRGQAGVLDLRFMPTNADIQKGDVLVTSGIDGIYPAGLAVAKVTQVENKSGDAFARIVCQPLAGIDRHRQLLVLLTEFSLPPRPPAEDIKDKKERSKGAAREAAKDAAAKGSAAKEAAVKESAAKEGAAKEGAAKKEGVAKDAAPKPAAPQATVPAPGKAAATPVAPATPAVHTPAVPKKPDAPGQAAVPQATLPSHSRQAPAPRPPGTQPKPMETLP